MVPKEKSNVNIKKASEQLSEHLKNYFVPKLSHYAEKIDSAQNSIDSIIAVKNDIFQFPEEIEDWAEHANAMRRDVFEIIATTKVFIEELLQQSWAPSVSDCPIDDVRQFGSFEIRLEQLGNILQIAECAGRGLTVVVRHLRAWRFNAAKFTLEALVRNRLLGAMSDGFKLASEFIAL